MTSSMAAMEMPAGSVFSNVSEVHRIGKFYHFLKDESKDARLVGLYGGAGSGKSVAIVQYLIDKFFSEKDIRMIIIRKTGPALHDSTYTMFLDELDKFGYIDGVDYKLNKSTSTIFNGQNIVLFRSLDSPEKKKSLNLNYAYIEEATEISFQEFQQIELRLRRPNVNKNKMLCSWNPVDFYHWSKTQLVDKQSKDTMVMHSTFLDNPFLPEDYCQKLRELEGMDESLYQIYALGNYAAITNVIYTNYTHDLASFKHFEPICYGLDFGWNAPSALVSITKEPYMLPNEFYVRELFYQTKHTNSQLIEALKLIIPVDKRWKIIYADNAEPDRIEEICKAGFTCVPAEKAITKGLDTVKSCKIHLHPNDVNILNEIRSYKWKTNRNEQVLDEPIGMNDHALDAMRYAIYSYYVGGGGAKIPIEAAAPKHSKKYEKIPSWGAAMKIPKM